jgi:hypothetical protein
VLTSAPNVSFTAFAERVRNDLETTAFNNEQPFEVIINVFESYFLDRLRGGYFVSGTDKGHQDFLISASGFHPLARPPSLSL